MDPPRRIFIVVVVDVAIVVAIVVDVVHPVGRSTREEGDLEESKDDCEPNLASQLAGAPTTPTTTTAISAAVVSLMTMMVLI